jgi:hypothetical protein
MDKKLIQLMPDQMKWLRSQAAATGTPINVLIRQLIAEAMKKLTT